MSRSNIVYARNSNGKLAHVNTVPRGLACGCTCIVCSERLVSRQGDVMSWHFAHTSDSSCGGGGPETILHLRAKQMLTEVNWEEIDFWGPAKNMKVELPYPDSNYRSDVGNGKVFGEIIVHHGLDEEKYQFIKRFRGWVVAFELTDLVNKELTDQQLKDHLRDRKKMLSLPEIKNSKEEIYWNIDPTNPEPVGVLKIDTSREIYKSDGLLWWKSSGGHWYFLLPNYYAGRVYLPRREIKKNGRIYVLYKDFREPRQPNFTSFYTLKKLLEDP